VTRTTGRGARSCISTAVDGGTAHMRDGGCMSVAECARCEIRLPSEALS